MEDKGCSLIGMIHIPIDSIVAGSRKWGEQMNLPAPTSKDWKIIREVSKLVQSINLDSDLYNLSYDVDKWNALEANCRSLSFYDYLEKRMLHEAEVYSRNKIDSVMIENIAGPYFVREKIPAVCYGVMGALAGVLREHYPEIKIGVQILACGDHLAMEIAVRHKLNFLRSESALFEGMRPEGRSGNRGNLAQLYMEREMLAAECKQTNIPLVYVDIVKKHTVFPERLQGIDNWLDNILFQKLEGIILTGSETGQPVNSNELQKARNFIDLIAAETLSITGAEWRPPLIVGSGVTATNCNSISTFADIAIIGSAFKVNGFWENELDEERVIAFMQKWNN